MTKSALGWMSVDSQSDVRVSVRVDDMARRLLGAVSAGARCNYRGRAVGRAG